jgi:hypothetical protein
MASFSLDQMTASLIVEGFDPAEKLDWLEKSYAEPGDFFKEFLAITHGKYGYTSKSRVFRQYDFYYDIFEKKGTPEDIAYIDYDSNNNRREVTYKKLRQLVDAKAYDWQVRGAVNGKLICLVYKLSLEYLVCVLAALKLGLILSFLSPARPYLLKKQLRALDPDYISTDAAYALVVNEFQDKLIERMPKDLEKIKGDVHKRSWAFISQQSVARLFDFSTDQLFEPFDITCDELYLNSIRDGLLALDLKPGDIFAAPGYSYSETQPAMLISVLMAGAAFLDVKPENYKRSPGLLEDYPISILGINPDFRKFIQEKQIDIFKSCRFWFRNPSPSTEYNKWYLFIKKTGIDHILSGVLKWQPQIGGLLFFSRRRRGLAVDNLMPSAGSDWHLTAFEGEDDTPSTKFGVLSMSFGDTVKQSPYFMAQSMYEWLLLGSRFKEKQGKCYPRDFVAGFIRETRVCKYFFLAERPRPVGRRTSFDLLVFTGLKTGIDYSGTSDKIKRKITAAMGKEYCPDNILFYPILPRLNADTSVDGAWCESQYARGGLLQKSKNDIFLGLSAIKELILKEV